MQFAGPYDASALSSLVSAVFGDLLYTPGDQETDGSPAWPDIASLVNRSKRVIAAGAQATDALFDDFITVSSAATFDPNTCPEGTPTVAPEAALFMVAGDASVTTIDVVSPPAVVQGVGVNASLLQAIMQCGQSPLVDDYDAALASASLWSWAPGYPSANAGPRCAALNATGRWQDTDCNEALAYACVRADDRLDWAVAPQTGAYDAAACPDGRVFGVPRNALENNRLWAAVGLAQAGTVYIAYRTGAATECWAAQGGAEWCYTPVQAARPAGLCGLFLDDAAYITRLADTAQRQGYVAREPFARESPDCILASACADYYACVNGLAVSANDGFTGTAGNDGFANDGFANDGFVGGPGVADPVCNGLKGGSYGPELAGICSTLIACGLYDNLSDIQVCVNSTVQTRPATLVQGYR
jgi:hypothetical protein